MAHGALSWNSRRACSFACNMIVRTCVWDETQISLPDYAMSSFISSTIYDQINYLSVPGLCIKSHLFYFYSIQGCRRTRVEGVSDCKVRQPHVCPSVAHLD